MIHCYESRSPTKFFNIVYISSTVLWPCIYHGNGTRLSCRTRAIHLC